MIEPVTISDILYQARGGYWFALAFTVTIAAFVAVL